MTDVEFAFYPGETPLYEGEITVTAIEGEELPTTRVAVPDEPVLEMEITSKKEHPLTTLHTGYFVRHGDTALRLCRVDMELPEQPSIETVARAILAVGPDTADQ